ncbi:hypothetical protein GCM10007939_03820 [Amylibacter marinus]|uniref:Uncharacterized protein n=1 Tax=Amylibacter marinus TaxID=1475483 RepID=A0ABQ5VSH5_9RHOB|nr:hypothetical protein [Amylibacter marinus]GLQ34099.1 hypothetical protein GCM10007939_03820 [Amylibacter marinus]
MKYFAALIIIVVFSGMGYAILEELIPTGPGKHHVTEQAVKVFNFSRDLFGLQFLGFGTMFLGYFFAILTVFQKSDS